MVGGCIPLRKKQWWRRVYSSWIPTSPAATIASDGGGYNHPPSLPFLGCCYFSLRANLWRNLTRISSKHGVSTHVSDPYNGTA